MKVLIAVLFSLQSLCAWSANVIEFNQALIDDVQKDLNSENDDQYKAEENKKPVTRGPASVDEEAKDTAPESKTEKINQTGTPKW